MPILRIHRKDHFTVIPNEIIRDAKLSLQAKMILVTYLSNTDGYEVSNEYMETTCTNGRESIRSAVNELIEAGYYKRDRFQAGHGHWHTSITVTTDPFQFGDPPSYGNPSVGEPTVGEPSPKDRKTREKNQSYESASAESEQEPERVVPIRRGKRQSPSSTRIHVAENSPSDTSRTIGIRATTDKAVRVRAQREAISRPDSGGGLAKDFGIRAAEAGLAGPQQVNGAALASRLTAWLRDENNPDTPQVIRAMMDEFFRDPKSQSDVPLWRRFLSEAPRLRGTQRASQPIDYRAAEQREWEAIRQDAARGDIRAQKALAGEDKPWRKSS